MTTTKASKSNSFIDGIGKKLLNFKTRLLANAKTSDGQNFLFWILFIVQNSFSINFYYQYYHRNFTPIISYFAFNLNL